VQVPLVALAAALGVRLLPSAAARHRILLAAVALSLLAPAASLLAGGPAATAARGSSAWPTTAPSTSAGPWKGWLTDGARPSVAPAPFLGRAVVAIYLMSLILGGHRRARAWRRAAALRRSAGEAPLPPPLPAVVEECARRLGLRDAVVRLSPDVASPATLGARRPLILIPAALAGALDRDQLTAAIGHEMAHVRRHDFAWNAAAELACWPIAFHPATAWLRRRLRQSRELACDALVAERVLEPRTYARSLAALARVIAPAPALTLGVADAGILEERVMSLVNGRARRRAGILACMAASSILAAASGVAAAFAVAVDGGAAGTGAAAVVGSWSGRLAEADDVPAADLKIAEKDGRLSGRVTFYLIHVSADGRREVGGKDEIDMLEPSFDGQRLTFKLKNPSGETVPMTLRLTGEGEGELATQVTTGDGGERRESRGMVVKMKRVK